MQLTDLTNNREAIKLSQLTQASLLELQQALDYLGFNPGIADGKYGTNTQTAWTKFKISVHQDQYDLIGPASVELLKDKLREAQKPNLNDKEQVVEAIKLECNKQGLKLNTQIAYLLATVQLETGNTFQPVKEAYWLSENWRKRNIPSWPYFGRGFVQITWKINYEKYSKLLNVDLINNPDLALDPHIALYILVHGAKHGLFTGQKLEDYINDTKTDFINARRVINILDKAQHIANLTYKWLDKLK